MTFIVRAEDELLDVEVTAVRGVDLDLHRVRLRRKYNPARNRYTLRRTKRRIRQLERNKVSRRDGC